MAYIAKETLAFGKPGAQKIVAPGERVPGNIPKAEIKRLLDLGVIEETAAPKSAPAGASGGAGSSADEPADGGGEAA